MGSVRVQLDCSVATAAKAAKEVEILHDTPPEKYAQDKQVARGTQRDLRSQMAFETPRYCNG